MSFNILLVDDSEIVRAVIRKTLALARIPVAELFEATNGKEGLQAVEAHWIDLIFSDLHMPEMDGLQFLTALKERGLLEALPVIVLSSEGNPQRIAELKELGIRSFIRKPFTPEQIQKAIKEVTGWHAENHS